MITLHGFPRTRSWRVSWTLEELGVEWAYQLVNLGTAEHRSEAYSQLNPRKKVPTIDIDGFILTESAATCLFLAEKYGNHKLLPQPGSIESARHLQWLQLIICEIEQPLWTMGKHKFALPQEQRVTAVVATAKWEFAKILAEVEQEIPVEGYLIGEQFTVADILLAQTLNWAQRFELELSDRAEAYRARLTARPAAQSSLNKELAAL
ncbi:glutathione S-transferase family protein [Ferrimonas lipolytica]|uniref:Glutathione S-transferase family protein n=1 Tax=Ferrimonas lipolytica TaxID=2724191 RepID=A0A6H1UA37_9GAMM|nr:glutathione S-transferase family protein [Ferrimonas lipolytica]QIZ75688.1 glutathione S-transferase family protein [Ferrimonas lipolytica]